MPEFTQVVDLFEKEARVGGRCLSEPIGDHIIEYGTCYAIYSHRRILHWMKQLGIRTSNISKQEVDDASLMKYINKGKGPPLPMQILKYLRLRKKLLQRETAGDPSVADILATPTQDWLRALGLHKVERLLHRVMTMMGYGYLQKVPLVHALRWIDFDMFLTGVMRYTRMPIGGWQNFWDQLSADMDVRHSCEVTKVERGQGVRLHLADGSVFEADLVVNTLPMHVFDKLSDLSEYESDIRDGISWSGYSLSLICADSWFENAEIKTWSEVATTPSNEGRVFVARREIYSEDFGGRLYAIGQAKGEYTEAELAEILLSDLRSRGAVNPRIIRQVVWPYGPQYSSAAIRDGLIEKMKAVQGENDTFHTGSIFSHESVANITEFNAALAPRLAAYFAR